MAKYPRFEPTDETKPEGLETYKLKVDYDPFDIFKKGNGEYTPKYSKYVDDFLTKEPPRIPFRREANIGEYNESASLTEQVIEELSTDE